MRASGDLDSTTGSFAQPRRKGYATEASEAILSVWSKSIHGEMLAMIRYDNLDSKRVAEKLGFDFLEMQLIDGTPYEIYRL